MSDQTVDWSILPDKVFSIILSFLPTKQAAATSILSKTWERLWLTVPTLDFDDETSESSESFRDFVYSVLLLRDPDLPIRSLSLKCSATFLSGGVDHDVVINRFVCVAGKREIEILNLDLCGLQFPPHVLSCKTLVVLKLTDLSVAVFQFDSCDINFPLLRTLHLDRISFYTHEYLMKLLFGCPILENLQTKGLDVVEIPWEKLIGRDPMQKWRKMLPKLVRANISGEKIRPVLLTNAVFVRVELNRLNWKLFGGFRKHKFQNLTHIELIFSEGCSNKWICMAEMLGHCPRLQNLTLEGLYCGSRYNLRPPVDWDPPEVVPECLSSNLRTCLLRDYKGTESELTFAKYIMQNSKVLRTMTIQIKPSVVIHERHREELTGCPMCSAMCRFLFV